MDFDTNKTQYGYGGMSFLGNLDSKFIWHMFLNCLANVSDVFDKCPARV